MEQPQEERMRRILLATIAAAAVVSAIGLTAGPANALTSTAPTGLREAIDSTDLAANVRWVCRYNWQGRRHCWWEPPRHRRHWRHRHW
jgi:hypothetical protein